MGEMWLFERCGKQIINHLCIGGNCSKVWKDFKIEFVGEWSSLFLSLFQMKVQNKRQSFTISRIIKDSHLLLRAGKIGL